MARALRIRFLVTSWILKDGNNLSFSPSALANSMAPLNIVRSVLAVHGVLSKRGPHNLGREKTTPESKGLHGS